MKQSRIQLICPKCLTKDRLAPESRCRVCIAPVAMIPVKSVKGSVATLKRKGRQNSAGYKGKATVGKRINASTPIGDCVNSVAIGEI